MPSTTPFDRQQPAEIGFTSQEFLKLGLEARIEKCRLLAAEAETLAAESLPSMRQSYLELAKGWRMLADEIARQT